MTVGQNVFRVNTFPFSFSTPQKYECPGNCRGIRTSFLIKVYCYSFNEFGSDMFLGDFRLR